MLGGSRSSRLDKRLLHEDKLVDSVSAGAYASQLGSNFVITADVKQGVDPAKVEAIIDEELKKLVAQGPTATELAQAKTVLRAGFVRGVERIGGFGGKADALAECAVYDGDPGCFRDTLKTSTRPHRRTSRRSAASGWRQGDHTLVVVPGRAHRAGRGTGGHADAADPAAGGRKYKTVASDVDRKLGVPVPSVYPELKFPTLQRATLSNGTKVILAERHDVPVVQFNLLFDGGYKADQGGKLGTRASRWACSTKARVSTTRSASATAPKRWAPTSAPASRSTAAAPTCRR